MKNLIFVLEDDKDIAEILEMILRDSGYRITCSPTVNDFHDQLSVTKPDLVLLDINLPDGNGAQVCKNLKFDNCFSDIPVILMSAGLDYKTSLDGSLADDFIAKPFDIFDIEKRIRALVA